MVQSRTKTYKIVGINTANCPKSNTFPRHYTVSYDLLWFHIAYYDFLRFLFPYGMCSNNQRWREQETSESKSVFAYSRVERTHFSPLPNQLAAVHVGNVARSQAVGLHGGGGPKFRLFTFKLKSTIDVLGFYLQMLNMRIISTFIHWKYCINNDQIIEKVLKENKKVD